MALDFLSYRSWLNPVLAAPSGVGQESTRYEPRRVTSGRAPELFETKNTGVPIAEAARLEAIGKNLNPGVKTGPRLLILRRGATSLDGMYLRNIILDNREVYYTGQPLILENVIFSNCKFVLGNDIRGRQLAGSILTSPSVTFRAG